MSLMNLFGMHVGKVTKRGGDIGECYNSIQPRANTEVFINLMKK